jgi:uncharacterized protein YjbI with pentapeptide repeats
LHWATYYGFNAAQLYSTASYQSYNLTGIRLDANDLAGWSFAGQNLTNANFAAATLTDADFTGAEVRGADFDTGGLCGPSGCIPTGITLTQLYSTASYQAHDLTGIGFGGDFSRGNFVGQNLTNADFGGANLTDANFREANLSNANFSRRICNRGRPCLTFHATLTDADLATADARGASGLEFSDLSGATTANLIWPDGHIDGLDLNADGRLVVRDHYIPITVDQHLAMAPGGTLRMVFEADAWDSTISFAPGIPVTLGGTLELTFAEDVNLASQVGRTFDLFDWTGVTPTGEFTVASPYTWNLSNLYTTGEVTLTAIPEPASCTLVVAGIFLLIYYRRRKNP